MNMNGNIEVKPKFGEFQLLGDSIFVRFANKALNQRHLNSPGPNTLGFCVSGQRINQLRRKIKKREYHLSRKVMILIGTNDVLCGRDLTTMIRHFTKLLRLLKNRSVMKMVILTLPPVPKLSLTTEHWEVVKGFNQFLLDLETPDKIRVLDISSVFLKHDCPILASPPEHKRKIQTRLESSVISEYQKYSPKQLEKHIDSSDDENDEPKVRSSFCRYLNRVNKLDALKEAESSDDEGSPRQIPFFINYNFWRQLREQLPQELDESNSSLLNASNGSSYSNDSSFSRYRTSPASSSYSNGSPFSRYRSSPGASPLSSLNNTMTSESGATPKSSSALPEKIKNVMEYTNRFIRLEYYEKFYCSENQRIDMIHPNSAGLFALKKFISQRELV